MDVFDETIAVFVVPVHSSPVWFPVDEVEGFISPEVILTELGLESGSGSGLPENSFVFVSEGSLEQVDLGAASWEEEDLSIWVIWVVVDVLFSQAVCIYIKLCSERQFMVRCFLVLVSFDVFRVWSPNIVQAFH